jgi:hypothetical protein
MDKSLVLLKAFYKKYWIRYNFDNKKKPNQYNIIEFLKEHIGYVEDYDKILLAKFIWEFWKVIYYIDEPTDKKIKGFIIEFNKSLN